MTPPKHPTEELLWPPKEELRKEKEEQRRKQQAMDKLKVEAATDRSKREELQAIRTFG